jgi:hypothetical protein
MRTLVVALFVVIACKSGDKQPPSPTGGSATTGGPTLAHVPVVESPAALAAGHGALPPLIVYVDDAGKYRLDAVAQWAELPTRDPAKHGKPAGKEAMYRTVMESFYLGQDPIETV